MLFAIALARAVVFASAGAHTKIPRPLGKADSSTSTAKLADGRVPERIASYTQFWDADASKDSAEHTANRIEHAQSLTASYYDGATELYEYGWAQSFHFSRFYLGEGFKQSVRRY